MGKIDDKIKELEELRDKVVGAKCEVYARIVGYYRSVKHWNIGKKEEWKKRKEFDPEISLKNEKITGRNSSFIAVDELLDKTLKPILNDPSKMPPSKIGTIYFFYRARCPNCPPFKEALSHCRLGVIWKDVETDEGFNIAAAFGIMAVPTVLVLDEYSMPMIIIQKIEELKTFLK